MARTSLCRRKKVNYSILFRLWSFDDTYLEWEQQNCFTIPSDSAFRNDLKAIGTGDYDNAQNFKDDYENCQRNDKKLREANKNK